MGDLYNYFMSTRTFTLVENKIHMSSETYEESGGSLELDLLTTLY